MAMLAKFAENPKLVEKFNDYNPRAISNVSYALPLSGSVSYNAATLMGGTSSN